MDEQFALLAIKSSIKHARLLYEMLLSDKLQGEAGYRESIGHDDILSALNKVSARIVAIESCEKDC
jgi:hypothetical protein